MRQLGGIETYNICRNINGLYSNFAITGHYNRDLTKEIISNALKLLIHKYSVFAVYASKPEDSDLLQYKDYTLKSVDSIEFDDVVVWRDEPFTEESLQYLNEFQFSPNNGKPTWKVVIFSNNYLSFINDHLLFDGESGRNFHYELVNIIANLESDLQFKKQLYVIQDIKITPSPNDLSIYKYNYWTMAKLLGSVMIPQYVKNYYNYYFMENYPNLNQTPLYRSTHKKQFKSYIKNINIPQQKLSLLLKTLKSKGITLTSFLAIYINYCFQNTIVPDLSDTPVPMKCTIPVSGRRWYSNSDPELTQDLKFKFVVSSGEVICEPVMKLDDRAFELMKTANNTIQQFVQSQEQFNVIGFVVHDDIDANSLVKPNELASTDVFYEISNAGFANISQGDWRIDDLLFSQSNGTGNIFGFSVASTSEGGLNIVFSHLEEYDQLSIQEFIIFFKSNIDNLII